MRRHNRAIRIHIHSNPASLLPGPTLEQWSSILGRRGLDASRYAVSLSDDPAESRGALSEAEVLVTGVADVALLFPANAPQLRLICVTSAGIDRLARERLPPKVGVINNSGAHAPKGAEYLLMATLMLANHIPGFVENQRREIWSRRFGSLLAGRSVCIVGLGAIGGAAARLLRTAGMRVVGVRNRPAPNEHCDAVVPLAELDAYLSTTEILILACPLTRDTAGLLSRDRVDRLPAGAGVVNIGRGELLDQDAVCDALESGRLGGAILDVFAPEPVPPGHRLWTTPRLIMTPHMSAGDPATYAERSLDIFIENIEQHRRGLAPRSLIDLARGY